MLDVLTPAVVEAAGEGGYILDGFPRTLPQATAAAELAARLGVTLDAAVYLHAPEAVLTRRLLDRASQSGRSDDKADVIRHRLQVYAETTGPLVPYYTERGILVAVDADQPPDSVTADIQARLSGLAQRPAASSCSSRARWQRAPRDRTQAEAATRSTSFDRSDPLLLAPSVIDMPRLWRKRREII